MDKPLIICATILIETSPQALPLGAACIASAIKNDVRTKNLFKVVLKAVSKEDKKYNQKNAACYVAEELLKDGVPKYLCLSVYVWNRNELEQTAEIIKTKFPEITIIAGGPEVTASPLSFCNSDYSTAGQGENAVPELIDFLEKNTGKIERSRLPCGVYSKEDYAYNSGSAGSRQLCRTSPPSLQTVSSPYLDGTLNPSEYGGALWELARGCPFKCSYCYESKGERKIQYFPKERIEKELELFNSSKINQVFVLDPTYNADEKRALELLKLIEKKAPGIFFYFEARAEFISRELAKAFTRIPCALQFGLQSSNPEILKYVNRTFDKKLFVRNIGCLNKEGVIFGFDLIYGLPKDTLEGFRNSMDFALSLYPNNLETFCLSVLPGTALFEEADALGLEYKRIPPYHVTGTDSFPPSDIRKASVLSDSCSIFYNQGRAVPWFMAVVRAMRIRPSAMLEEFARWFEAEHTEEHLSALTARCPRHIEIEKLQVDFIKALLVKNHKEYFSNTVESIILFHGALSRTESDGKIQTVRLFYHPDDIAGGCAQDIPYFSKMCGQFKCKVQFFPTKNGADWKTVK